MITNTKTLSVQRCYPNILFYSFISKCVGFPTLIIKSIEILIVYVEQFNNLSVDTCIKQKYIFLKPPAHRMTVQLEHFVIH